MKKNALYRFMHSALALLLSTVMLLGTLPTAVFATGDRDNAGGTGSFSSREEWEAYEDTNGDYPFYVEFYDPKTPTVTCAEYASKFLNEYTEPRCPDCYPDMDGEHLWDCQAFTKVTCTELGVRIYKCLFCGMLEYVYERPAGHNPGSIIASESKAPTCTEDGYDVRKCVYCDEEFEDPVPALGHLWILNENESTPATVREPGKNVYFCGREGCSEKKEEYLEPLGDYQLPILIDGITDSAAPNFNHTEYESSLFTVKEQVIYPKSQNGDPTKNGVTVKSGTGLQNDRDQVLIRNYADTYHYVPGKRDGTSRPAIFVYGDALDNIAYQQEYLENHPGASYGSGLPQIHKYCDITIDMRGEYEGIMVDIYLVNFGVTTTKTDAKTGKTYAYGTKGIADINIIGDNANVYLVNSNLGYIDYKGLERKAEVGADGTFDQGDGFYYEAYDDAVNIFVDGFDSHLYMGPKVNSTNPLAVHCNVSVRGDMGRLYYNAATWRNPIWCKATNGFDFVPDFEQYPTVELSNMTVDCLGRPQAYVETLHDGSENVFPYEENENSKYVIRTGEESDFSRAGTIYYAGTWTYSLDAKYDLRIENGVFDKFGGALLSDCVWNAPNGVDLDEYSMLSLYNTDVVYSLEPDTKVDLRMHSRSELTLGGEVSNDVKVYGTNKLHLDGAAMAGTILVDGVSDDAHFTVREEEYNEDKPANECWHGIVLQKEAAGKTGVYYYYKGANLTLLLGRESRVDLQRSDDYGCAFPAIMVDNEAVLTIQDDPDVAGVGALTVGPPENDPYYDYYPNQCAAIGGTPSLDPEPHGWIFIESGVLTTTAQNGAAAIGGSAQEPAVFHKMLAESYYAKYEGTGEDIYRIYRDTSIGYLYYDASDARYNPYEGGWFLKQYVQGGVTRYYPVDRKGRSIEIPAVYSDEVDEENSRPGFHRDGGRITIRGGVVNATAEGGGAALGGANGGNGGSIEIKGGTVNAKATGGYGGSSGAAIGGGQPVYEVKYERVGYQELQLTSADGNTTYPVFVYVDREEGNLVRKFYVATDDQTYTIKRRVGEDYQDVVTIHTGDAYDEDGAYWLTNCALRTYASSAFYQKKYQWISGGESGKINITGGSVVNAWADNPYYNENGREKYLGGREAYHLPDGPEGDSESFDPHALNHYDSLHWRYDIPKMNNSTLSGDGFFVEYSGETKEIRIQPISDLYIYTDPYTGNTFNYDNYYLNGMRPGNVIGSTDMTAAEQYGNELLIGSSRGVDPVVILGQNGEAHTAAWDHYYYFNDSLELFYDEKAVEKDETGDVVCNGRWYPAIVDGSALILCYGYDTEQYDFRLDQTDSRIYKRAYRVRGQIDLPQIPGFTLSIPEGATLTLTDGSVMNVPRDVAIMEAEEGQLIVEDGAVIQGAGLWPNKPADPKNPPTTDQVRSLLEKFKSKDPTAEPTAVTHLAIVETSDGQVIISGNGADDIRQQMQRVSLSEAKIITVINAGDAGFKKIVNNNTTTWQLNTYSPNVVVSLVENGALVAVPGKYTLAENRFDVIVKELGNSKTVTVELRSAKLSTPDYMVYEGTADDELELQLEDASSKLAFRIELDKDQVLNNSCIFSVPKFSGSEFSVSTFAPLKNKCALRFGGTMKFTTPVSDIAGVEIEELQINYGSKMPLGGIKGGGFVKVPDIAGFPVNGSAELTLNTFAPNRELSLSIELETPIFEGAFEGSFKEARGVILLDTLYAEIAAGEGGIPLVPPTVVGYLQGGGLGFTGLADTVNMDSFGAPPIRLKIATKGSILDVIEGWARVSIGPSGFDLQLSDIEIAGSDFIQEFGISAGWDAMEKDIRTSDGTRTYWGIGADMNMYLVIGIPIPGYDNYGDQLDDDVAGISATGSVGLGGFAGYAKDDQYLYFVYQLHASGNLSGRLSIPKGLVAGLPLEDMDLAGIDMGFYAEANATSKVDKDEVNTAGNSAMSVLRQLSSNVAVNFNAAVGAKAFAGLGKAQCYVRAIYVLGEKGLEFSAGFGDGGEMDLSGYVNTNSANNNNRSMTVLTTAALDGSDEPVPAICQASARVVTNLAPSIGTRGTSDQATLTKNAMGVVTASVSEAAAGKVIFSLDLDNQNAVLGAGDLTVTRLGVNVPLVLAQFDQDGNQTNSDECNFFSEAGRIYFAPSEAGAYSISTNGNVAGIAGGNAIVTGAFATLDESTAIDSANGKAIYKVNDPADDGRYKVQLFLGESEGVGDYLLADSGELTAGQMASELEFSLSGNAVPSDSYYPSVLLLEYVKAGDVGTWAVVDQINYKDTVAYINSEEIAAPANVTLAYSGNGTMTANWDEVSGADKYQLAVYEEYAVGSDVRIEDTGLRFQTEDGATSLIMDLSSLYGDTGTTNRYSVGVKAVRYYEDGDRYQTGREGRSAFEQLVKAAPPKVSYSDNVALGEDNYHSLTSGASGTTFTITGDESLTISVRIKDGEAVVPIDSDSSDGKKTLSYSVSEKQENSKEREAPLVFEIVAKADSGDYTLDYISVTYDTVAPPLVLDNLGSYPKWITESGNYVRITGHTEAGATVFAYKYIDGEFKLQTGVYAEEDGSFSIPMKFVGTPSFSIQAVDSAGNKSAALIASFPDSEITVNLDANGGSCATASIGLASGAFIGTLPTPTVSDNQKFEGDDMAFLGWYLRGAGSGNSGSDYETGLDVAVMDELLVTSDMIFRKTDNRRYTVSQMKEKNGKVEEEVLATFSKAPTLVAHWDDAALITFAPGANASCAVETVERTIGGKVGKMPVPQRIDGSNMLFLGWYTSAAGGAEVTESSIVPGDVSYYAHWAEAVTVSFDAGLGGLDLGEEDGALAKAFTEDGCLIIEKGSSIAEYPDATSTGYAFKGWYTDADDGSTQVTTATTYSADTTLYAKWERNTADLDVTQEDCVEGKTLTDPVYTVSDNMVGMPTVSYKGTGSTSYLSTAKPTAEGTYRVTVSYDTFETAYVGSADFAIRGSRVLIAGLTANNGMSIPASGSFTAAAQVYIPTAQQAQTTTVLFAYYGENGRFLQMTPVKTLQPTAEAGVYSASVEIQNSAVHCVRVFVLDSEWAPLCASAEITRQ